MEWEVQAGMYLKSIGVRSVHGGCRIDHFWVLTCLDFRDHLCLHMFWFSSPPLASRFLVLEVVLHASCSS